MTVLIIYGTTEGQTRKIARFMEEKIREAGEDVRLVDSADLPNDLDVDAFDAVIAAGSVHNGHHQAALFQFVCDHLDVLRSKPSAFVSVSLSMASDDKEDRLDAAGCVDRFTEAANWKPTLTHMVAGALRYTQYDFFKSWMLKMIAGAKGASTDTSRDHEFTDWKDLEAFTRDFLDHVDGHADRAGPPPKRGAIDAAD